METHTLRVWRQMREMSVEEMATRTNLHPVTIRNHETGYLKMSKLAAVTYANILGIEAEQIELPTKRNGSKGRKFNHALTNVRMPLDLYEMIVQFQKENNIKSFNAAAMELIRKGLKAK
jgi:predicted transcriptional regulator